MMYKKPKDISYTAMCIYIDNNIYSEYDENLVYEYLYHLSKMLAIKHKYFHSAEDYDNFSLFAASTLFLRLTTDKDLPKVKSILNYIKSVIYPLKVDFQKSEYSQVVSKDSYREELNYNFNSILSRNISSLDISDFGITMMEVGPTCRKFLSTIPYDKDSTIWMNIYISVMLTFLNSVTLRNKSKKRLQHLDDTHFIKDYHLDNFFADEREDEPILYHLPDHMKNYIDVLSRQLRNIVAKDLCDILQTKVHSDYELAEYSLSEFVEESLKPDEH